jgi:hypothetical protein
MSQISTKQQYHELLFAQSVSSRTSFWILRVHPQKPKIVVQNCALRFFSLQFNTWGYDDDMASSYTDHV